MKRCLAFLLVMLTLLSTVALPVSADAPTSLRPYDSTSDTSASDEDVGFFVALFAALFGIGLFSAVIGFLTTVVLFLLVAAYVTITMIGCLKLNRRYRELTKESPALLDAVAIVLSLFGLGVIYLIVMALVCHTKI